jgi:hypothetical protein
MYKSKSFDINFNRLYNIGYGLKLNKDPPCFSLKKARVFNIRKLI